MPDDLRPDHEFGECLEIGDIRPCPRCEERMVAHDYGDLWLDEGGGG